MIRLSRVILVLTAAMAVPRAVSGMADSLVVKATREVRGFVRDSIRVNGEALRINRTPKHGSTDYLSIDFGRVRDVDGLVLQWDSLSYPREVTVYLSKDASTWQPAVVSRNAFGGSRAVFLPKSMARAILIECKDNPTDNPYGLRGVTIIPGDMPASAERFVRFLANSARVGLFPGFLRGRSAALAELGDSAVASHAVLTDEGIVYPSSAVGVAIEPFLFTGNRLLTWNDGLRKLEKQPVLQAIREHGSLQLSVLPFFWQKEGIRAMVVRYRLQNSGPSAVQGKLFLALRPFAMGRSGQKSSAEGEVGAIMRISYARHRFDLNGKVFIYTVENPKAVGVSTVNSGEIVSHLDHGSVPSDQMGFQAQGLMSGAASYQYKLGSGKSVTYELVIPLQQPPVGWMAPTAKELLIVRPPAVGL